MSDLVFNVYVDQGDVLARMVDHGIGVGINKFASKMEILEAVHTVLLNEKYRINIKKLSNTMKMRKIHPMESAMELLELVVNTNGADHLKVDSRHLNIFQYCLIDCILLLLLISYLIVVFTKIVFRKMVGIKLWR